MIVQISQQRWSSYYQAVQGRPSRETLRFALDRFEGEASPHSPLPSNQFAVDLGCGNGRDTIELLRRGWHVLAIDGEQEAIAQLRQQVASFFAAGLPHPLNDPWPHLETQVKQFESLTLPGRLDLINASFCLPFCPAESFDSLWKIIVDSLKTQGRFCGQLFGDRDSWTGINGVITHSSQELQRLLSPFEIESLVEEEHPGKTALGEDKDWHIFHIVARKK